MELQAFTDDEVQIENMNTEIGIDVTQEFSKYINSFDSVIFGHCGSISYSILEEFSFIELEEKDDVVQITITTEMPNDYDLIGIYDVTLMIDLPEWSEYGHAIYHYFQVILE